MMLVRPNIWPVLQKRELRRSSRFRLREPSRLRFPFEHDDSLRAHGATHAGYRLLNGCLVKPDIAGDGLVGFMRIMGESRPHREEYAMRPDIEGFGLNSR